MEERPRVEPITDVEALLTWSPESRVDDEWCQSSCPIAQVCSMPVYKSPVALSIHHYHWLLFPLNHQATPDLVLQPWLRR